MSQKAGGQCERRTEPPLRSAAMSERFTTRDGRTLGYHRRGSGPTLVCHPGGPGFSSLYFGDLGGLDRELELVLLDPRGTGGSGTARDPRAYAIADYAADVEELREHLGLERILARPLARRGRRDRVRGRPPRPRRAADPREHAPAPRGRAGGRDAAGRGGSEGEPWYEDAVDALQSELRGEFSDGRELMELGRRMMPLYYADYGEREQQHVASLADDRSAWTRRGSGRRRSSSASTCVPAAAPDDANARDNRRP